MQSLPEYYLPGSNELTSLTKNHEKVILEIGFGNGDNTAFLASQNPNALIIAAEVYLSGIGSLLASISEHSFTNIKIFDKDVRELLLQVDQEIFDEVYIICPDPWPKERHHKRRLINDDFLNMIQGFIKIDGHIFISTDWENYAESIEQTLNRSSIFSPSDDYVFEKNSLTKFEQRGVDQGRRIFEFNYRKNN